MGDNKFIKHLRGEDTAKSVLEIKNQRTTTSFANMPDGTSNANDVYSDHRGNATGVLKGTENWKLDGQDLVETTTVYGDGRDFTDSFSALGNTLWVDATCTFATARRFSPNTKFVLKLCGHDLETLIDHTVDFTLIVKFGVSNLISKTFTVTEQAFDFCKEFVIDFAESNLSAIKADAGSTMQIQLLCADADARAVIYNGMTVFTALQRRVDGDVVASDKKTFDEVVQDIEDVQDDIEDIDNKIIIRSATIPTASASLVGKAYQYAGATNGQYTHNYIYECQEIETNSYGWVRVDVQPDRIAQIQALQADITDIQALIPTQASPTNQLADKNFVNSSISTNTSNFIGTFNSVAELEAYSGAKTNNDYAFVIGTDSAGNTTYNRYKYTTATTPASWVYEYTLNNSSFTATQWTAINSGVTASDVSKARSAVQPSDVGNGTITIRQGSEDKGSFTTNQSEDITIDLDEGGGYHPGLFAHEWDDHIRNDVQWLRADTFSWQSGSVYKAAYQHLVNDIDGKTLQSETIGSTTIQFYLADDGHKICPASEESNVATIYTATGVAWYYIIDTINERFKLPRTKFGFTGLRDTVGKYVESGIPNIKGYFTANPSGTPGTDGTLITTTDLGSSGHGNDGSGPHKWKFEIDASRSSSVYRNDIDTVQSPATQMYLYFYVGNFTQTAIENTAGLNAELFNGKQDVLTGVSGGGDYVVSWQTPTAGNNYTWYRKYKSGWVEQGGKTTQTATSSVEATITLPVEMQDTEYTVTFSVCSSVANDGAESSVLTQTATTIKLHADSMASASGTKGFLWEVKGVAAQ